jgi:type IV pilus assembly protein PilP
MSTLKWAIALLALLALVAAGCQKKAVGPKVGEYQKQRAAMIEKHRKGQVGVKALAVAKNEEAATEPDALGFGVEGRGYIYDPIGKRDPFRSFILDRLKEMDSAAKGPLEQFDLSQLSVNGIVWDADRHRALILDPSGQGYIIQEGDPIGKNDGRVMAIDDNVVVVREAYVDFHGETTTKEIEMHVRESQGG